MNITVPAITITLTGAASGSLTCASTTGLYVGQEGWAVKSDLTGNIRVVVAQVIDTTHFLCQSYANRNNAGGVDLSLYNGGKVYFDEQVVYKDPQYVDLTDAGVPSGVATLDAGGLVPTTQLPTATTLVQGAMPATEMAKTSAISLAQAQELGGGKLTELSGPEWFDNMIALASAEVEDLTYQGYPATPTNLPTNGTSVITRMQVDGGGVAVASSGNIWALDLNTGVTRADDRAWALGGRIWVPQPSSGQTNIFGLSDTSGGYCVFVGVDYAYDHTHLMMSAFPGSGGWGSQSKLITAHVPSAPLTIYDVLMVYTVTALKLYVNGALAGVLPDLTPMPIGIRNLHPGIYGYPTGGVGISKYIFGVVTP